MDLLPVEPPDRYFAEAVGINTVEAQPWERGFHPADLKIRERYLDMVPSSERRAGADHVGVTDFDLKIRNKIEDDRHDQAPHDYKRNFHTQQLEIDELAWFPHDHQEQDREAHTEPHRRNLPETRFQYDLVHALALLMERRSTACESIVWSVLARDNCHLSRATATGTVRTGASCPGGSINPQQKNPKAVLEACSTENRSPLTQTGVLIRADHGSSLGEISRSEILLP